jgi:hypothetical protein
MTTSDVLQWLTDINLSISRGSESRAAFALLLRNEERGRGAAASGEKEWPHFDALDDKAAFLSEDDLVGVYAAELKGGKFW